MYHQIGRQAPRYARRPLVSVRFSAADGEKCPGELPELSRISLVFP
jgi:hypothetical protein